jgi:S1-C subfamily serine protease
MTFVASDAPPVPGAPTVEASLHARKNFNLATHLPLQQDAPLSLEEARRAVGYVTVRLDSGSEGSGTGFVVTPQGHFLTAYHVVERASTIHVSFEASPQRQIPAELVGWDAAADLAVLRLAESGIYPYCPLAEREYTPPLGESVAVLGYPLGEELGREISFTEGTVSSLRERQGATLIQLSATVTHGSSGAPLFRRSDLRVIGVIHGGVKQEIASGFNFAISVQEVYRRFGTV